MRLGCCTDIANAAIVKQAGFDFLECTVTSLMTEDEDGFQAILKKYQESPLPVEVCNVFLPGNMKIVGGSVDYKVIECYVATALSRVKQIGAKKVVFGSGGARSLPADFSTEEGEQQVVEFLKMVADYAELNEITIVIEPLNKKESNIINSIPEAVSLAKRVDRESIQVLADFYHMEEEEEALENIIEGKDFLKHIHVADSARLAPGTGGYPYQQFVSCLKEANYEGLVSIECRWDDFETEVYEARKFLSQLFV